MVVHGHSGDLEAYLVADVTFHRTLLEASGNEMFGSLGDVVAEVLAGRTHHGLMPDRPNPEAIAMHDAVARASAPATPARPSDAMRELIEEAATAMREELGRLSSELVVIQRLTRCIRSFVCTASVSLLR